MQHDMKSINLFGQEEHVFTNRGKSQKGLFNDYEGFVEKFKPKKKFLSLFAALMDMPKSCSKNILL